MPEMMSKYIISDNTDDGKLLLQAEPDRIRDSIAYWLESNKALRYTMAGDVLETRVTEKKGLYFLTTSLSMGGGLVGNDDPTTYEDVITAKVQRKDSGSLLGIEADFPQELQDRSYNDETYLESLIVKMLLKWVKENQERVTLGYGPDHPLDDINPLAVSDTYNPRQDRNLVDNFSRWLQVITEATAMSSNEHAFYVDGNNNSIGTIAGGRTRVTYPASSPGDVSVSAHTHPTVKSLGFPSETDLNTMAFRCTDNSVSMIVVGNAHSNFVFDRDQDDMDRPEMATADYPFTEVPVTLIKQDDADTEYEIQSHHRDQADKIKTILDQQLQHKRRGIDSVESQMSEAAFQYLESEFDKAVMLRDKLVEENKAIKSLNEVGIEENKKFTIEQEPLAL